MTNKELATDFVKKYSNMFVNDQWFWVQEIEKLLDQVEQRRVDEICEELSKRYCKHDWLTIEEIDLGIITDKGRIFQQRNICQNCDKEEIIQVIYSHVGIGWTPEFEGIYNG